MGLNNHENGIGDKNRPSVVSRGGGGGGGGGPTRSWGTTGSGQSISTSGSVGSPSTRSETAMVATPASESKSLRLNNIHNVGSQEPVGDNKKKRGQRATGADKGNRGLRQFSMKVCQKVESKGRTTYNEVADELVAEFADPIDGGQTPDKQQYEEKNIRRRVYDALNVIMAMDIISKDKKEIQWKGLPRTTLSDVEEIKRECLAIRSRIDRKAAYLKELQDQHVGLQNLVRRNERLHSSGNAPNSGVALPFILVQTQPHATVEVEISEDMQLVHFDFNSTPFELHDDNYVIKAMNLSGRSKHDDMASVSDQSKHDDVTSFSNQSKRDDANSISSMFQSPSRPTTQPGSLSIPGILKPRVKHEH